MKREVPIFCRDFLFTFDFSPPMKYFYKIFFFQILFFKFCFSLFSQEPASVSGSVTSHDSLKTDTNYIKSYDDKLIIGLWQSENSFDITLAQKMKIDTGKSTINYIANSNHISGISFDYDVIGFDFGYKSIPSGDKRTGNTKYTDFGFNINTSGFRFENSYRNYSGFYDKNTANYTHPFTDTTKYFQNPSMTISQLKSKLIYTIRHRRFGLGGAYANSKRQVKSAGSVLLIFNFYSLGMRSESSIIPPPLQKYYSPMWDRFNKLNVYGFSSGAGLTRTFVIFKRFYFNVLLGMGLEMQNRNYYSLYQPGQINYWQTWVAGDWRTALGYNGKRFFIRSTAIYDFNNFESSALRFEMKFVMAEFDFGYRFNFRPPKPYKKFQQTKLYKFIS